MSPNYYHREDKASRIVPNDAVLHIDIIGRINPLSYLRGKDKALEAHIEPKIFEHGFLLK